ncbi:MAG: hypothetical protein ABIA76_01555 [Candidatus Diapherotrites archaeon]
MNLIDVNERNYFLRKVKYIDSNWGAIKGGKKGIVELRKKYGIKQIRN